MKLTSDEIFEVQSNLIFAIATAEAKLERTKKIFNDEPGSICIELDERELANLQRTSRLINKTL